jgi:hypothetical protein
MGVWENKRMTCPVCAYNKLPYAPRDYEICPCCGTEFGNDDAELSHQELRQRWADQHAPWFFGEPPEHWNPWLQLIQGGYAADVPTFVNALFVRANTPTVVAPIRNFSDETLVLSPAA